MLNDGDKAPDFTIPTDEGEFSLNASAGPVVVFFFPRADTSGCTKEAIAFSELKAEFDAAGVRVIGISKDTVTKQGKFRAKYDLAFPLGADDEGDVCEQFGVWVEKSMYGKKYMGIQRVEGVAPVLAGIFAVPEETPWLETGGAFSGECSL